MADKQDLCSGSQPADSLSGLHSVERRQAHIEQNEFRLDLFGFPNGFPAVSSLTDLKIRALDKSGGDESPEGRNIIYYECLPGEHISLMLRSRLNILKVMALRVLFAGLWEKGAAGARRVRSGGCCQIFGGEPCIQKPLAFLNPHCT